MKNKFTYKSTAISCYIGFFVQAVINNFPSLLFVIFREQFGVTLTELASLVSVLFLTQLAVDIFSIKYVDRIGYRLTALVSHFFSAVGLIMLGILPRMTENAYLSLVVCSVTYAIGAGFQETVLSPIVESISDELGGSSMSFLHSFYCVGQCFTVLITTLFIKVFSEGYWYILCFLWALVPIYNFMRFLFVPMKAPPQKEEKTPIRELLKSKFFIIAMIIMVGGGASELAMVQWSSMFAEKGLGVSKVTGDLLGPMLFAVFMFLGRQMCARFEEKINIKKILFFCSCLCVVCYIVTSVSLNPYISLFACAICGFSVSCMWPGTLTLASNKFPNSGATMFSILALCGDIGCSLGPFIAGRVSDLAQTNEAIINFASRFSLDAEQASLRTGIISATIFPIIIIVGFLCFKEKKQKK